VNAYAPGKDQTRDRMLGSDASHRVMVTAVPNTRQHIFLRVTALYVLSLFSMSN